ncbi:hypothetical protein [Sinorhizobium meliloti]|uniref:hypothetical protein n=1 Tax=Rhizobium meliloti TaxID=382 RepID=UPI003F149074
MKHIFLGYNAVALEPSGDAERVDAVPKEFFKKYHLAPSSYHLYKKYVSKFMPERDRIIIGNHFKS